MNPRWMCVLMLMLGASAIASTVPPTTRPAAEFIDVQGGKVDPLHAAPGAANVVIFVRTDCPISNSYAPLINDLSQTYSARGVVFYLVYTSRDLSITDAKAHLKAFGYTCPAIIDSRHTLVKALGAVATPEAFVVAPDGSTIYHGRIDDSFPTLGKQRPHPTTHELKDAIDAVLGHRQVTTSHAGAIGCAISDD